MDIDIFDPNYVQKQQVASLQQMAAQQNALRVQAYNGQCRDWITVNLLNRDKSLPLSAIPAIPKKITVSDEGDWSEAPFTGLQPPVLPEPVVAAGDGKSLRAAANVPPDRIDQILAILALLNAKLDALAARNGAR